VALRVVQTAYNAIMAVTDALMNANSISLVVLAIEALTASFVLAYNKLKPFHDAVNTALVLLKARVSVGRRLRRARRLRRGRRDRAQRLRGGCRRRRAHVSYASVILADNPVAYWLLTESGTAAGAVYADATGHGHDVPVKRGGAYTHIAGPLVAGGTAPSSPNSPSADALWTSSTSGLPYTGSPYTLEGWLYASTYDGGYHQVLAYGPSSGGCGAGCAPSTSTTVPALTPGLRPRGLSSS
jgi:hypothetical protein